VHILSFVGYKGMERAKRMDFPSTNILTPYNYFEWNPKVLLLLKNKGLYQISMGIEVEPNSVDEKAQFINI
jgi:hypothetical protein